MKPVVKTNDCHDLDSVRSGDLEAFGRIHDRHAPLVLSICRRRGFGGPNGSPADAEDATQEVFIRAYRKIDTVEDCTRLRSWLCAIAGYVLRERRRAAARRHHHEGVAMSAAIRTHGGASSVTPEQELSRRERFAALESALENLADEERLAIHIHYLEHDPVAAAKESLGLSRSGFYKLLARARTQLANQLRDHAPEDSR